MSFSGTLCKVVIKMAGWSVECKVEKVPSKCVFCVAPHTSNWDFIVGKVCYTALDLGIKPKFLIKKFWTDFPFGLLIKPLGGIGVDRNKSTNLVETVVAEMAQHDTFQLAVTPEGTRSRNANWKRGFYLIAEKSHVPIVLVGLDYKRKKVLLDNLFYPSGDMAADMSKIKSWFVENDIQAKHPENFVV